MSTVKTSAENSEGKPSRTRGLRPWKKGQSGNPKGKPKGVRDRKTVLLEALTLIATKKGITAEEVEAAIQVAGIEKSLKGSFFHYKEISDGLYGKIQDKMDVTSGGKTLAEVLMAAHARRKAQR